MFHFTAYVKGPEDSVYRHKLVKLQFEIPDTYPLVPPVVKFIQHSGARIHPNLYVEGKVCLSILGTWPGEPWAFGMKCDSVLITIRSLLDNNPYLHEPHQKDNPEYNEYVRYATWRWLLLDYLEYEKDPVAREWLRRYIRRNGREILIELKSQADGSRARFMAARKLTRPPPPPSVPPTDDGFLFSPYRPHEPAKPMYDSLMERFEKAWNSTLADELPSSESKGEASSGSGGTKRKIDDVHKSKDSSVGGISPAGAHKQQKTAPACFTNPQQASHPCQPPKKQAKAEPEVIDLT